MRRVAIEVPPRPVAGEDAGAREVHRSGLIGELQRYAAERAHGVPLPGHDATRHRFAELDEVAARDLALGRLVEGHLDALAILREADTKPVDARATYGVWAARSPRYVTEALLTADRWHLWGEKAFCSGSTRLDRALVTAETPGGYRLFDISIAESVIEARSGSWPAVGMADSISETLVFRSPPLAGRFAIGPPGFYLERPGFWFGAIGVAACWLGGARGLVERVGESLAPSASEAQLVELGHAVAHVNAMTGLLEWAADAIDADPTDSSSSARNRAMVTRHTVQHAVQQVLGHVAAAGGAGPLCHDAQQARRAADLYVYLAQHHGPQDAALLGREAVGGSA